MNRRKFLGWFGIGAAVAAVPMAARTDDVTEQDDVIQPILLERTCDGGKASVSAEEWKRWDEDSPTHFRGCGTRFRWYLGVTCVCPHCGWTYWYTAGDRKAQRFFVDKDVAARLAHMQSTMQHGAS